MDKKSSLLAFMLGMAVGSVVTWQIIKERYERRIEEDRKSLEEMYATKKAATINAEEVIAEEEPKEEVPASDPKEVAERAKDKPSMDEYIKRLRGEGYTDYTHKDHPAEAEEAPKPDNTETPYVISPEEFGEMDGYEKISLTYYADGVLADEDDEPVDDIEELIGDGLEHFGEYGEEDSVFVRSDMRRCDYEILKDLREFSEVVGALPPRH